MISAVKWVPRGAAKEHPERLNLDEEEMMRISELAKAELLDANLDLDEAMQGEGEGEVEDEEEHEEREERQEDEQMETDAAPAPATAPAAPASSNPMDKYNMDDYDDEPNAGWDAIASVRGASYHALDEKDEYLQLGDEEDEDEKQDLQIMPTDNLVLAAKTEDGVSTIEVYVYDEAEANLYVHHDFMLPSFPLCLEWVPFKEGKAGNQIAVGTFEPEIEIWDLDVIDAVYPTAILGQRPNDAKIEARGTGKKKKQLKKAHPEYHVDAVLSLSSNPNHINLLASGSADCTVKLWDLNEYKAVQSFEFHASKVSSVKWNPLESTVLLSGGYDHNAIVSDLRGGDGRKYRVEGDIESTLWHPDGAHFFVGTDKGQVYKFDARMEKEAVWTLHAHDDEVATMDISGEMLITGSSDKRIKLWNLNGPSMLLSRDLDVGRVFTTGFAPDSPGVLAVGGSEGKMKIWNAYSNKNVRSVMAKGYEFKGHEVLEVQDDMEDSD